MQYIVNNSVDKPEVITTATDLIKLDYVYGKIESESGDEIYNISSKLFDDEECSIPCNTSDFPFTIEYTKSQKDLSSIEDWLMMPSSGIDSSSFTVRCGIPHNSVPDTVPSRTIFIRIKGWRIKNPSGLESIESYVKVVGKITINPSSSARKLVITWL